MLATICFPRTTARAADFALPRRCSCSYQGAPLHQKLVWKRVAVIPTTFRHDRYVLRHCQPQAASCLPAGIEAVAGRYRDHHAYSSRTSAICWRTAAQPGPKLCDHGKDAVNLGGYQPPSSRGPGQDGLTDAARAVDTMLAGLRAKPPAVKIGIVVASASCRLSQGIALGARVETV
jgi:hypothetical protein